MMTAARRLDDSSLRAQIVERFEVNAKMARSVVRRWFPLLPPSDFDDALSIAFVGLWKACLYYRESTGYRFSTYAYRCMKTEFIKSGLWRNERRRQGLDYNAEGAPRLVSLETPLSDRTTLADLLAGEGSDPVAALLRSEELSELIGQIRERWVKIPRSVKMRLCSDTHEAIAEVFGPELSFVPTEEETRVRMEYKAKNNRRAGLKRKGEPLPEKERTEPKKRTLLVVP